MPVLCHGSRYDASVTSIPPIPHTTPGIWPTGIPQGRLASRIRTDTPEGCKVALLGLPDDLGVRLNNGRPGAKDGPTAFRAALARYGVAEPFGWEWPAVYDAGDVTPAPGDTEAALFDTHVRITAATRALVAQGLFPIAIGGGHDLTLPFVRGVIEYWKSKALTLEAGVYFDAHLDVRETAGSGMPFRRLIEDCGIKHLTIHGMDPYANSRDHARWFLTHGGVDGAEAAPEPHTGPKFVSIDLDVLDASAAPGVSAINPNGWTLDRLTTAVRTLAADQAVRCMDIMEFNPAHDESGRTARVAAHLFLTILRGFAARSGA